MAVASFLSWTKRSSDASTKKLSREYLNLQDMHISMDDNISDIFSSVESIYNYIKDKEWTAKSTNRLALQKLFFARILRDDRHY